MFRPMDSNDRSYYAGASDDALITIDEEAPVMMVVDGNRIEIHWTDDELDCHNYAKNTVYPVETGRAVKAVIDGWLAEGIEYQRIQVRLEILLPELGFQKL